MAMILSCTQSGLRSVSLPAVTQGKPCVSGGGHDYVHCRIDFGPRSAQGLLNLAARSSRRGFLSPSAALIDGSKGQNGSGEHERLLRSRKEKHRQIGLAASSSPSSFTEQPQLDHDDGGNGFSDPGGCGGGGGGENNGFGGSGSSGAGHGGSGGGGGVLGAFIRGWDARVKADPQFAFKVLMEEIIGVGACVAGDMATRPNFGRDELDLVFSTLVVGSILNFTLMYMLAPTAAAGALASKLPGIFGRCPAGHMFESGAYTLLDRTGTFFYKGVQFATVGFFAGLVGTGISTALINARKKMDPAFIPQNASPPVLLNAGTWAIHMGLSSNSRYQTLNGLEFALAKIFSPGVFKVSVTVLRGLNNVLGGTTFVALARLTGSQPRDPIGPPQDSTRESASLEKVAID